MPTYQKIRDFVLENYGHTVKTCWIAHVKELNGLNPSQAPNRVGPERLHPCPENKREAIENAFRHFGMI